LPSSFPSHLGDYSTEEAAAFTRRINQRWGINRFTAIPDQKISLTSHRSFDAGDWKIGNIANVNWSTGYDYSETVNNNYIAYDVANDLSRPRFEYNDVRYKNTSKLGALFNWSFMKGDHKYEFRNFFSQRGVSALTQREGMNYYSDKAIRKWESLYTGRTTYSGQLGGTHTLQEDINKVDWTAGYAFAAYRESAKSWNCPSLRTCIRPGKRRLPLNTWTCSRFPPSCAARQIFWKPAPRAAVP